MIRGVGDIALLRAFLFAAARGHISLDADDGLDLGLLAGFIKFNGAEHIAVIGERQRRHVALLRRVNEILDAARAVEQAVVGMIVEVDEAEHVCDEIR